jgi:multidrug efflux pump subunit AcrA (membrane-fusion protein)
MKTRTKWIAALVGVLVLSAGISRAIVARKAQQNELSQSMASAQGGAVMLSSRDVVIASEQALQRSLAVSGSLTAQRSAIVKAKVAAELLKLTVREGDAVAAGQVIGQLDPQEFEFKLKQSQEQAASAKAQWQIAQQNLENSQALVKQGFISRNALDHVVHPRQPRQPGAGHDGDARHRRARPVLLPAAARSTSSRTSTSRWSW